MARNLPTHCCAGVSRKTRSIRQRVVIHADMVCTSAYSSEVSGFLIWSVRLSIVTINQRAQRISQEWRSRMPAFSQKFSLWFSDIHQDQMGGRSEHSEHDERTTHVGHAGMESSTCPRTQANENSTESSSICSEKMGRLGLKTIIAATSAPAAIMPPAWRRLSKTTGSATGAHTAGFALLT